MENKYISYDTKGNLLLPNIKKIFIPDEGMEIMDADLSGADAQIYGADSECKKLLDFFENPLKFHKSGKLYAWVASEHLQRDVSTDDPEYKFYKASHHGVWYGMAVNKLALTINCTVSKAQQLLDFYDYLYPEKDIWQKRLVYEANTKGYITNIFGRRFWFPDTSDLTRNNKIFSSIPQSTTSEVINRGWINIRKNIDLHEIATQQFLAEKISENIKYRIEQRCNVLLQVHDSLVIQYPIELADVVRPLIQKNMLIELPYKKPITIPADFKVSEISYGDCQKVKKVSSN